MKRATGFTLVELSLALIIIGLVLSGMLGAYRNQLEANRIRETRQALADIREALFGFTLGHGHLPCPADPALASASPGAGVESRTAAGQCTREEGVLPWATLGLKELDAWGGRFSYRITDYFADTNHTTIGAGSSCAPAADLAISFAVCSSGDITILSQPGTLGVPTSVAVFVSHGKNLQGAYGPQGGTRSAGSTGAELENANEDTVFISQPFVNQINESSSVNYDDLVEWIPASLLIGKMVEAKRLP